MARVLIFFSLVFLMSCAAKNAAVSTLPEANSCERAYSHSPHWSTANEYFGLPKEVSELQEQVTNLGQVK